MFVSKAKHTPISLKKIYGRKKADWKKKLKNLSGMLLPYNKNTPDTCFSKIMDPYYCTCVLESFHSSDDKTVQSGAKTIILKPRLSHKNPKATGKLLKRIQRTCRHLYC